MTKITKLSVQTCTEYKEKIAYFIHCSMNRGDLVEWYSMEEARAKSEELAVYLGQGKAIAFLAEEDTGIAGFIWAYPCPYRDEEERVYISIVYIDETFRGQDIGRTLVHAVEEEARTLGYRKMWLHTGGQNSAAIRFYNRVGFSQERVQFVKDL